MRRLIMLEIEADSRDCGRCKYRSGTWCTVFDTPLREAPMGDLWSRADACMKAEERARGQR